MRNTLEAARKKWCIEENAIEANRKQITEVMAAKVLKSEERRKAFEARWNEVKARNQRALDEGTFEGPIVPIGWRPPEPPKRKGPKDEASAEKVSFLQPLVDVPEGSPRVSEGGSSGSRDPVAPPEAAPPEAALPVPSVPPPAAPPQADPPEAALPEAAPSKAEEVKQRIAEAPDRLKPEAYVSIEEEFIAVAKPEDLREQDREIYEKVRGTGLGVCARCRWQSGCHSCDEVKAWGYACRLTLWNTASEELRPKTKPRGRPKKAA